MLQDVNSVIKRIGVLLDDPSNSIYTADYLMPWIDQSYDELDVDLERAGMQYIEAIATVDVAADVTDLSNLFEDGQALASAKLVKRMKWKLQGWSDNQYVWCIPTGTLPEVVIGSYGATYFTTLDGALQITPSSTPLTLKIYFDLVSTNIVDPATGVIRGTAHILAAAVAAEVAGARTGMEKRSIALSKKHMKLWNAFKSVLVKNQQDRRVTPPAMHLPRVGTSPIALAPTDSIDNGI